MKTSTARAVALAASVAVFVAGCGAGNDSAPVPTQHDKCVSIDTRLASVMTQIQAGHLKHVADILSHDLDEPSQRAVIALLLAFAKALPPGAAEKMPPALQDPRVAMLLPLMVKLLAELPGDPNATPVKLPRTAEMKAFSMMAQTCLSRELFVLLEDFMRDKRSPDVVSTVLVDVMNGGQQIRDALATSGASGKQGFLDLLHNSLTSIAAPDFDPLPLVQTMDGLTNPQAPTILDTLDTFLRIALLTADGKRHIVHSEAVSTFAGCMLANDPSMTVLGLAYDVLLADAVTATTLPGPTTDTNGALHTFLPIFAEMNDVLVNNDAARDAWTQILGLLLRPDIAVKALPEVIDLLNGDTVPSLLALVNDLLTHPCPTPGDP